MGKKKIIILGAGFAGLRVVQELNKNLGSEHIILIDRNDVHIYNADLYEVATAFNEKITNACLRKLKETVATPIHQLINGEKVHFYHDEVTDIHPEKNTIQLKQHGEIPYTYLIVALGSTTNYFNIPGLEKYALPMKNVADALRINCHLDFYFHHHGVPTKENICITIGGGGATGIETAAELVGSLKKLSKKYHYPREKITIQLIEAGSHLAGLEKEETDFIRHRLEGMGVKVLLEHRITHVYRDEIEVEDRFPGEGKKKKMPSHIIIWTGGIMVNPIVQKSIGTKEKKGAIEVNEYLQSTRYPNIFAAGDNTYFENNRGERVPLLAQIAIDEGTVVAKNIIHAIQKEPLIPYKAKEGKYIIPLGGKCAICELGNIRLHGFWCWVLRRLVSLKYSLQILPFWKAVKKWEHGTEIFIKND